MSGALARRLARFIGFDRAQVAQLGDELAQRRAEHGQLAAQVEALRQGLSEAEHRLEQDLRAHADRLREQQDEDRRQRDELRDGLVALRGSLRGQDEGRDEMNRGIERSRLALIAAERQLAARIDQAELAITALVEQFGGRA